MKTTANKKSSDSYSLSPGLISPDGRICGSIRIFEGAIATIVKHVIGSVEGVTRLSGSSLLDNLAEIVGSKKIKDRAIQIQMHDEVVAIEISINVAYGVILRNVCAEVQRSVSEEVQRLTGLKVSKINVVVREMEEPQSVEADEN